MKKLLIISPKWEKFRHWPFHMSLLGPLTVAGLTPDGWDIEYMDENAEPLRLDATPDIVAISAMTAQAARGYEIADSFRARNIPVVMGGIHATLVPDEAVNHADSVVIGEAEGIWPTVLADYTIGALQPRYQRATRPDLSCSAGAFARRDLLPKTGYTKIPGGNRAVDTIQAGRGCGKNCEHCNVPAVLGVRFRPRPLNDVLAEIATTTSHFLFLTDDCLPTEPVHFANLFSALRGQNRRFLSVGALHLVNDLPYLKLLVDGGLRVLYLGFDRLDPTWRPVKARAAVDEPYHVDIKMHDVDFCRDFLNRPGIYLDAIKCIRDHGISIIATFAFGFDDDSPDIFERCIEFAVKSEVELADFAALTPYPKSPLAVRLARESRILTTNWRLYNGCHAVFRPKLMSPQQLEEGTLWAWDTFNREKPYFRRMIETFRAKDEPRG